MPQIGHAYNGLPDNQIIKNFALRTTVLRSVGAIKMNETGLRQRTGNGNDIPGDRGNGIMQLTSEYYGRCAGPGPRNGYEMAHFIVPARTDWATQGETGESLAKGVAVIITGLGNAKADCSGDVDEYTTNNYGERAVSKYQALVSGTIPE